MPPQSKPPRTVAVIGGGPAGLMAAETIAGAGVRVTVFDAMPSMGRKFLVAGKGGLNITRDEPFEQFLSRYGARRAALEPFLTAFGPAELRAWFHDLGFETFTGSSGKVFPRGMNAGPVLHAWLERLRVLGVAFLPRHRWRGWTPEGALRFSSPAGETAFRADATVLALGGASWPHLGSDGGWVAVLRERGVPVAPLKPANCGFDVTWSDYFRARFAGEPIKAVRLRFGDFQQRGEFVITGHGVEGSLIYAASARLREEIERHGQAVIHLDLAPDWTLERLRSRLSRERGSRSLPEHYRRTVNIRGVKFALLREFTPKAALESPAQGAEAIKNLAIPLLSPRPLAEAISTAGGVDFAALDENLMLRGLPGVFCAGEMLDWEAPTGGYLLTACFSTGRAAGLGVLRHLVQSAQF